MKKKLLSILVATAMVVSVFAGCGSNNAGNNTGNNAGNATKEADAGDDKQEADAGDDKKSSDGIQVGIVLPTKDEPRWLQDQAQFEKILGDAGFSNTVLFSQGSSATEKTNVETLIAQGIEVLIICAQDGAAAAAAADAAKAAGVTVIAYDRLIMGTDSVDYYVTFDSVSVGEAQGQYLIDNAPDGSGIPLYLYAGGATDPNAFLFFEGAWNVLQPKIADGTFVIQNSTEAVALQDKAELTRDEMGKIIGQVTTDWDFNVAKSKAEAHLTSGGVTKGDVLVLAPNDGTARAIADVFGADKDVSSFVITGQDAEKASIQYVIDGKQSMTVFKDTRTLAADAVAMASFVLNGDTPETDTTYDNTSIEVPARQTAIVVVTQDNVQSALIDSGYYEAGDFTGL